MTIIIQTNDGEIYTCKILKVEGLYLNLYDSNDNYLEHIYKDYIWKIELK